MLLLATIVIVIVVVNWRDGPTEPITVINQTPEPLAIWGLDGEGELNRFHFELGFTDQNGLGREECEPGLVALREDGSEVARIGRICQGDPPWVISNADG